jgi:hypothetical protein
MPGFKFYNTKHFTVLHPANDKLNSVYFCRILNKFTQSAKPNHITGNPDNQRPVE